jgi:RNA polymerase sigma-70 factor, ECF subfamily
MNRSTTAGPGRAGAAIAELLEREGSRVYGFARRMCGGNPQDAEDLVQETFLNAYRAWDQLAATEDPRPWLYTIARHSCQRMRRRRAGEPSRIESFEELLPEPSDAVPQLPSPAAGPYADRLRAEAREIVDRALEALPESFRLPLVLADIAELDTAAIAGVLGLKEATVKTRVHRARMKLRAALASGLPARAPLDAPQPRQVCLDLLHAKLEALDRRQAFSYSDAALCDRCRTMFSTLDLAQRTCASVVNEAFPAGLRQRIIASSG